MNRPRPRPFVPDITPYLPGLPWPPRRYLPGEYPRPAYPPLETGVQAAADWRHDQAYLRGADLFNRAYWWEAHEAWEERWRQAENPCRLYIQGLIQIAAGLLKWHLGNRRGQQILWTKGRAKLTDTATITPRYMGLDLPAFLLRLDAFERLGPQPGARVAPTAAVVLLLH